MLVFSVTIRQSSVSRGRCFWVRPVRSPDPWLRVMESHFRSEEKPIPINKWCVGIKGNEKTSCRGRFVPLWVCQGMVRQKKSGHYKEGNEDFTSSWNVRYSESNSEWMGIFETGFEKISGWKDWSTTYGTHRNVTPTISIWRDSEYRETRIHRWVSLTNLLRIITTIKRNTDSVSYLENCTWLDKEVLTFNP